MLARLTARALSRHRGLIAGTAAVLAGFQVIMVIIASNLQRENLFSQVAAIVPPSIQAAFGGVTSFGGFVAFGFFHPVIVLLLAVGAAYLAGELTGDVEDGMIDLLAARPIPRAAFVTRAALAAMLATTATIALMLGANRIATVVYAPATAAPGLRVLTLLAVNLLAVTWCCAAAGLALAAVARKRATAVGTAALVFVALYLLNLVATWWAPARPFARLAPFHYFDVARLMLGTRFPAGDLAVLLAATAVLVAGAQIAYGRRDL